MPNITTEIKLIWSAKYSTQYLGMHHTWYVFQGFHSWAETLSRFCKCNVIFTCRKPASRARTLENWVLVISRGNLKDIQTAVGCCQVWVLFLKIRAGHKCFSLRTKFYWVSSRKRKNYKEMERNSVCSSRPVNVWPLFLFSSDHFIVSP